LASLTSSKSPSEQFTTNADSAFDDQGDNVKLWVAEVALKWFAEPADEGGIGSLELLYSLDVGVLLFSSLVGVVIS
jgi:hypothetical protein